MARPIWSAKALTKMADAVMECAQEWDQEAEAEQDKKQQRALRRKAATLYTAAKTLRFDALDVFSWQGWARKELKRLGVKEVK